MFLGSTDVFTNAEFSDFWDGATINATFSGYFSYYESLLFDFYDVLADGQSNFLTPVMLLAGSESTPS